MKPGLKLTLAALAFLLAAGCCVWSYLRVRHLEAALTAVSPPAPKVAKTGSTPRPTRPVPPPGVPRARRPGLEPTPRIKEMIAATPKSYGLAPTPRPESLFAEVPALKASFDKAAAAQMRLGYDQFLRTVALSASEEARFLKILADREATWGDVRASATAQGVPLTDPSLAQLDERNMAGTERDLQALLGAERYGQLQQYRETLDARSSLFSLSTLIATSYRTDTPVTLDQINRLAQLTTETGLLNYTKARALPDGVPYERVIAEARKLLTSAQAEVFELLVDHRQISLTRSRIYEDRGKK